MKKLTRLIVAFMVLVMCLNLATGCDNKVDVKKIGEAKYKAVSGFYYSSDNGHTYGDGTKEYSVGKTVYMKVKFKVISDKKSASSVSVVLSIPNIESVDAEYLDGQVIEPMYDPINNITSLTFTASASKEPEELECVIQFTPKAAGTITMTLVFDDNVDPSYDSQSTLVFVEDQPSETAPTETQAPTQTPTPTPEPTPSPVPTEAPSLPETSSSDATESSETTQETTVKPDN